MRDLHILDLKIDIILAPLRVLVLTNEGNKLAPSFGPCSAGAV